MDFSNPCRAPLSCPPPLRLLYMGDPVVPLSENSCRASYIHLLPALIFARQAIPMGNSLSPCIFSSSGNYNMVKLVFWGGATRQLPDAPLAGKLMVEHPDHVVCHAGSFYIGHPVPILEIEEGLVMGDTYFVIPIDRLPCQNLTAASLSGLSAGPRGSTLDFGKCPFQYTKGANGKMLIKVAPEFITRIISNGSSSDDREGGGDGCSSSSSGAGGGRSNSTGTLCSTPELQKHYSQLVTPRRLQWSPKLETISERKARAQLSPSRLLGLDWR